MSADGHGRVVALLLTRLLFFDLVDGLAKMPILKLLAIRKYKILIFHNSLVRYLSSNVGILFGVGQISLK